MIDVTRLGFEPLLGWPLLWVVAGIAALAWVAYLVFRGRAWLTRGLALTLLTGALANPAIVEEEREPLASVAAIVLDKSESMSFGERAAAASEAYEKLKSELDTDESLDVRFIESDPKADGTNLFTALEALMADVPRDRIAGAVFITDGQIHDLPADSARADAFGPIHGIIVGDPDKGDRRVEIVEGPDFGIVGERASFIVRADDPNGGRIRLQVSVNGGDTRMITVESGRETSLPIEIERRGSNIVVIEAEPGDEELTLANNRTAATISGVRDRLRVLLVTGRPNASGRVWRDLLKSDPSVDLVHFTILRPPFKTDVTPIDELALIAFPTEELFEEKLQEFDLIIFDQYERRGVVTFSYLSNMARYVDEGGAMLLIAGEPFASGASLHRTPLAAVLPAEPTGQVDKGHYVPELTDEGTRHSITAPLQGREWGGWLRYIEVRARVGDVLMQTPDGRPLLVVDRVGDGRVGQLMSDQIWLWQRGHEGGGPFAELIRRAVHWLMKEPELEERRLDLVAEGDTVSATLRTLSDTAPALEIETPEGSTLEPRWSRISPGLFAAEAPIDQLGLYKARSGGLEAVTLNGPANPKEYADLQSSTEVLKPISDATDGGVYRVNEGASNLPNVRRVSRRGNASGGNWLGLRERDAYAVRSSSSQPLLPGLLGAGLLILLLLFAWRREGR